MVSTTGRRRTLSAIGAAFASTICRTASRPRLETGNEEQIDNLDGAVYATDADGLTGWWNRQRFRILDGKNSSIGQVNIERLERPGAMHFLELFGGHGELSMRIIEGIGREMVMK